MLPDLAHSTPPQKREARRRPSFSSIKKPFRKVGRIVGRSKSRGNEDDYLMTGEYQRREFRDSSILSINSQDEERASRISLVPPDELLVQREGMESDPDMTVQNMEQVMRQVVLFLATYIIGATSPEWLSLFTKVIGYIITAWLTCVIILYQAAKKNKSSKSEWQSPLRGERQPLIPKPREFADYNDEIQGDLKSSTVRYIDESSQQLFISDSAEMIDSDHSHPSLAPFFLMDASSGNRIKSNGGAFHFSNEWIEMDIFPMIRTPDTDDSSAALGTPENTLISRYFSGRQRRFEFQFQFKVKKSVKGKSIYFACELEEPIKLGIVQRAFVGAAMAFMRKTNPSFHYSISGSQDKDGDGSYEKPHMAFTVLGSMDRVVISKPGETPPTLGSELYEDPDSIKRRKKGIPIDWNCEDTFTLALWSAYMDWIDWRVINLPGIRPFNLCSVLGNQCVNVTLYMIDENDSANDKHYRKYLQPILDIELSSAEHSKLGTVAQKWYNMSQKKLHERHAPVSPTSEMDLKLEDVDDNDDDETGAELGEGIYMRSGDKVVLRKSDMEDDENSSASFLSMGGGYAVLQDQEVSIVIQKVRSSNRNRLIHSGNSVYFKLIQKKGNSTETRYLTIKRGWWLKWVTSFPKKNGYFTIHPHETEQDEKIVRPSDSESDYLTMGSSFYLRHKRWSRFHVGVAAEPSATYGGRMLGLYNPKTNQGSTPTNDVPDNPDDNDDKFSDDENLSEFDKKNIVGWMEPIILCAYEPNIPITTNPLSPIKSAGNDFEDSERFDTFPLEKLIFSSEHCQVDVPAWIETMNRTERIRQLTYVVRVTQTETHNNEEGKEDDISEDDGSETGPITKQFVRLRTGRELARIIRVGRSVAPASSQIGKYSAHRRNPTFDFSDGGIGLAASDDHSHSEIHNIPSIDEDASLEDSIEDYEDLSSGDDLDVKYTVREEIEASVNSDSEPDEMPRASRPGRVKRGKTMLGKVAKTAKSATKKTVVGTGILTKNTVIGTGKVAGKVAFGAGKFATKGAVMAGKAVTKPLSRKKPPKAEPKAKKRQGTVARLELSKKTMKKIEKFEKKANLNFLAGELCAPEQSCRIASRVLSRMSSVPYLSPAWSKFNDVLVSQVAHEAEQDRWFLEGTAVQIGVTPLSNDRALLHESLGARCLWESHWREEWCGIYETCVSFYAPSTKSPCLEISFIDVTEIRPLDPGALSPLPGFHLLVLETSWLCHYIAFRDKEARDAFGQVMEDAKAHSEEVEDTTLRNARFWQGFQSLSNSSLSSGAGKWAKVSCGNKSSRERTILNGRRMAFDIEVAKLADGYSFVEDLLSRALSFNLQKLEENPESFVEFLDLTSQLRLLPLEEIDLSSRHAFCLFANIYHCLLQQAMLLSMNGPEDKKSMNEFMRSSCYEIGSDVFSLAELYCCVLRGKMSKASNLKPPYPEVAKKSNAFRFYALDYNDPRINFILSTGDFSCPRSVPVLRPHDVEQQLSSAAGIFLKKELFIDARSHTIILPKICDVYKSDFGGSDSTACLRFCLDEVDEETAAIIRSMMTDTNKVTIRYQPTSEQYHSYLQLRVDLME